MDGIAMAEPIIVCGLVNRHSTRGKEGLLSVDVDCDGGGGDDLLFSSPSLFPVTISMG